ncbi:MAG TPA: hypothetical protein VKQ11_00220 [Candidatus Sulfotelmatobacter sp.]|nr:hypothetical protein [Candidatus Sulfotelmatobacter sp.]
MTLLDAKEYDPEKARKKRTKIISLILIVLVLAFFAWWFRFLPEEHIVGKFFDDLQRQDYKSAYGIWMHDPNWQQHPDQHPKYPFNDFYRDWGPGGEWGLIKTAKVYGASTCPGPGSGVVVDVIVNNRAEHAQVWVEKSDHTLSFPPCELIFR